MCAFRRVFPVQSVPDLLDALRDAAIAPSKETAKTFGLWQTRCTLFGSPEVSRYAQAMMDTDYTNRMERERVFYSVDRSHAQRPSAIETASNKTC